MPEDDQTENMNKTDLIKPQTLLSIDSIHRLINRLEDKLAPVLTSVPESEKKLVNDGSTLMLELTGAENRLKSLLSRIHI